jgi:hypothetical protein
MSLNDQTFGADGAVVLALVTEVERHETEPPLALYVHGLHRPSAVRTRPWRCLPRHNPLLLVANENQTHPFLSFFLSV